MVIAGQAEMVPKALLQQLLFQLAAVAVGEAAWLLEMVDRAVVQDH